MLQRLLSGTFALLLATACASTPDVDTVIEGARPGTPTTGEAAAPGGDTVPDTEGSEDRTPGTYSVLVPSRLAVLEAQDFTPAELTAQSEERRADLDARCRDLLTAARSDDATYEELMAASRALVFNADLRIQSYLALAFDPADLPSPDRLINAEDGVPGAIKGDVRSLAQQSRDFADRALDLRPDDPAGQLFSTLGVGLSLWSMGPFQAIANGAATTLPKRIKKIANSSPGFEGASPLRLKGRFQSRAPWPYKDKEGGVATLERAVEIAPIPLNLLFLGDAYWVNGQEDQAIAAWTRARTAPADMETELTSPFLREISRLRIASANGAR